VKRIVFIIAVLGFGLICLQQQSYANKKESHSEYAKMEIRECNSCHKGEGVSPNHDADFLRGHRVLAGKAGNNCSQCHDQAWCLDCHQGGLLDGTNLEKENFGRDSHPKSHRSDWISIHPIQAQNNQQQCNRCHDQKYCTACHSRLPQNNLKSLGFKSHDNQLGASWGFEHGSEARRSLQQCQTCHADGDTCKKCHSATTGGGGVSPHPRGFKAGNYKDRSNSKVCLQCHLPGRF
jgi:hypothetical protein